MTIFTDVHDEAKKPDSADLTVKKINWWNILKSHFRRVILEMVLIFLDYDWLYWLIGLINKRINLIESVFLVYPGDESYALYYYYIKRIRNHVWKPGPAGLLYQDGKIIVMFAISATNGQFADPANAENIRQVFARMERLRQLFGAKRKSFAGILPGVLYFKRIIREAPEADLTAVAVVQAIDLVKAKEALKSDTPIIVLGGRGFIGRRVVKLLDKAMTYSIDSVDGQGRHDWPSQLNGEKAIVVNISVNNAIKDYIEVIQPGTIVINEVYPEPNAEILARLSAKGCHCYHVAGVKALALPAFPSAYSGAIPCCAAWPSADMKAVVRKLI